MPQHNNPNDSLDVLPAEKGLIYTDLDRLLTTFGAIAARTYGDAEIDLLVRDPDNDVGEYSWFNITELEPVESNLRLVPN